MRANVVEFGSSTRVVEVAVREDDDRFSPQTTLSVRFRFECLLQRADTETGVDDEVAVVTLPPPDVAPDEFVRVGFVDLYQSRRDVAHTEPVVDDRKAHAVAPSASCLADRSSCVQSVE